MKQIVIAAEENRFIGERVSDPQVPAVPAGTSARDSRKNRKRQSPARRSGDGGSEIRSPRLQALCAAAGLVIAAFVTACAKPDTSAARGHELYLSYGCAACHGPAGAGDGPGAATAMIKPRDLQMGNTFTGGRSLDQLVTTIRIGRPATGMPGYPDLPDDELRAIATWIQSIQKEKR